MHYSSAELKSLFSKFNKLKVFVVGDAMMDNYWYGQIDRISPEAPVPVVSIQTKESRPGGAANVAMNCNALGATVYLLTVLGKDEPAQNMLKQLAAQGIQTDFCLQSKNRVTTGKTRIMAKSQQVVRIDEEDTSELSIKDEHAFIDICLRAIQIEAPDILIFEDYNKGVLKQNVIQKIISHCKHVGVLTAVDPKQTNFLSYQGVNLFKPNLKEVKEALTLTELPVNLSSLKKVHHSLSASLQHQITLITLSEKGVFVQTEKNAEILPAFQRDIADVSGAGDTVISVAALTLAASRDIHLMASLSNLAGGLVCESVGVVPINKRKLLQEAEEKLK
jgi:rfaE bifunctional protein kinase chain/domain